MATSRQIEFGYNPPSGDRGRETIRPQEYMSDLKSALDVATQGFKSIWVADHLNYSTEWRLECWTLLTWIAARYPDVGLSTLVMSNTFRHPSVMAKMGATLQELSGGRFALGYGAGWHEGEHSAFGLELFRPGERIDRMEEAILVIKALWSDAPADFSGRYYSLNNTHAEPRPDPMPPIMIGGAGEKKTLRVVAKHADWWNDVARPVPELQHKLNVLKTHCDETGRDFHSIRKSVSIGTFIDRKHQRALDRHALSRWTDSTVIAGDPVSVREQYAELRELGFDMVMTYFDDFQDLTEMKLFVDEVIPSFD